MAYEILDTEKEFNNVRILYKKEIKYNDKIKVYSKEYNNKLHSAKSWNGSNYKSNE